MKKVVINEKPLTRQLLADPHYNKPHKERLADAKAVNLENNHNIQVLDSGYWRINPIDKTKICK